MPTQVLVRSDVEGGEVGVRDFSSGAENDFFNDLVDVVRQVQEEGAEGFELVRSFRKLEPLAQVVDADAQLRQDVPLVRVVVIGADGDGRKGRFGGAVKMHQNDVMYLLR